MCLVRPGSSRGCGREVRLYKDACGWARKNGVKGHRPFPLIFRGIRSKYYIWGIATPYVLLILFCDFSQGTFCGTLEKSVELLYYRVINVDHNWSILLPGFTVSNTERLIKPIFTYAV